MEVFNADSNAAWLNPAEERKTRHRKKVNRQLEPDPTFIINSEGKKELLIDSDDGIVEVDDDLEQPMKQKEKVLTKKQLRREEKLTGQHRGARKVAFEM